MGHFCGSVPSSAPGTCSPLLPLTAGSFSLAGWDFWQPEKGCLLSLAQPQLLGVVGEDCLPTKCRFPKLKCWGKEPLSHAWGSAALRLLPALWWWVGMGVNVVR